MSTRKIMRLSDMDDGPPPASVGHSFSSSRHHSSSHNTGVTGYVGSVILEQLLRVAGAQVGTVYILARSRDGRSAQERVGRVLGSGLFDLVRRQYSDTLRKVVALDGDLSYPNLGLSMGALAELAAEPSIIVIHSAASIALDDPIQDALRSNYEGTRRLLELVEQHLPRCGGFVHVSTTYVGMMLPQNSCLPEKRLPLMYGDQPADHVRLARELLAADKEKADKRAALLCKNWNLCNTYLLSKHLCEALVDQYHREGRIADGGVAIVRPSLVSALAGPPYPGYVGNLAGPSGYMTAFALGFFSKNASAWHPYNLLDSVPCDIVASVALGVAATLAAGIRCREQFYELVDSPAPPRASSSGATTRDGVIDTIWQPVNHSGNEQSKESVGLAAVNEGLHGQALQRQRRHDAGPGEILVFHAATSTVNPILHFEAYEMAYRFFKVHTPKFRLGGLRVGFAAWDYANDAKHDKTVFVSVKNVLALERLLPAEELQMMPLVWRGSWTEYGNTYMAAVGRLFMGLPVPPSTPQLPHRFAYIPFVVIPENELPPLAGTRGVQAPAAPPLAAVEATAPVAVPVHSAAVAATPAARGGVVGKLKEQEREKEAGSEAKVMEAAQVDSDGLAIATDPRVAPVVVANVPRLSVREALRDKAVLVTGATGYIGSVILEQLLRVAGAQLGTVYVLTRSRGGRSAQERVGRVLGSGLFDLVRRQYSDTLRKVVALNGDLSYPDLGLSTAALAELAAEPCIVVIHSAASIALDDPIQDALRSNYEGTRRLLELVEQHLPQCGGFVHVSTTYVGMTLPRNSCLPERMVSLMFGDQPVDHARLACELLAVNESQAKTRSSLLCENWNLINTYLLSKHLCEALVDQYHREGRIADGGVAIVRPSLVSALAGPPYPGYVGNLAGPSGYMTAFALGFFNDNSVAWHPRNLLDSVPCDIAAAVTLGAAATLAAGIRSREQFYELVNTREQRRNVRDAAVSTAAYPPCEESSVQIRIRNSEDRSHWPIGTAASRNLGVDISQRQRDRGEILVFHAATSTINPCMHYEAYEMAYRFFKVHTPKFRLGGYVKPYASYRPVPWKVDIKKRITGFKVKMAAQLLSCFGEKKAARRLRVGFAAWDYANDAKHDKTVFVSVKNVLALERLLPAEELQMMPLVWRGSWTEYGNTYMAAVGRLFMGLPVPLSTPQLPHRFAYIPFVVIPENELPPLAGTRGVQAQAPVPEGPQPPSAPAIAPAAGAKGKPIMKQPDQSQDQELEEELGSEPKVMEGKVVVKAPAAPDSAVMPQNGWGRAPQVELTMAVAW
ncbi:hypothetical protein VOLCADRAFT_87122 [Volvox carteri f. nagariensis]|uniref:Fatty acyl-CoA reductase n=1 Tax=Volvox carteri f. nagariensis TaxID=3068 RepID=D8TK82_VOLCA|nr:uncharacterized protein VOLCADRAFT_87122 [Volvox carteri f. nagariensis]EFJ52016.1 hypothetical protein VOLCADRAFT_87122 [Volvox carteri f. nagariensis]|eukprot:XP_002946790.1 hypothetical protein VOLCADRAFT_87122 [Volvox carteri f. nagariensis]